MIHLVQNLKHLTLLKFRLSMKYLISAIFLFAAASCSPTYVVTETAKPFEIERYMGRWYEIERLPNKIQEGLEECTSLLTLMEDGSFTIVNEGRLISDKTRIKQWKGKGWIPDRRNPSKMKVSYNWPFTEDYWVLLIDNDYSIALVGSPDGDLLWILSRDKDVEQNTVLKLKDYASDLGFPVKMMFRSLAD